MNRRDLRLTAGKLYAQGRCYPVVIGRTGLTDDKREGDGATPRGVLTLTGLLYRPDRLRPPAPWARPIGPRDLWSDDSTDPAYNQMVRAPHPFRHEALRRADGLYDLVLTTDWNWPKAEPGRGSAIFIHRWRGPARPTAGCLALHPVHLRRLAARLRPGTRVTIAQPTEFSYENSAEETNFRTKIRHRRRR